MLEATKHLSFSELLLYLLECSHVRYNILQLNLNLYSYVTSGAHKEKERLTSTYTRGSHLVIAGETALPCMEATKCLQTASLHCV